MKKPIKHTKTLIDGDRSKREHCLWIVLDFIFSLRFFAAAFYIVAGVVIWLMVPVLSLPIAGCVGTISLAAGICVAIFGFSKYGGPSCDSSPINYADASDQDGFTDPEEERQRHPPW